MNIPDEIIEMIDPTGEWDFDDATCTCPCGNVIEHDGKGPCGCVSPLRTMGMI